MTENQAGRWEKTRVRGKTVFVLSRGLATGILYALLTASGSLLLWGLPKNPLYFILEKGVAALMFSVFGMYLAAKLWKRNEEAFGRVTPEAELTSS